MLIKVKKKDLGLTYDSDPPSVRKIFLIPEKNRLEFSCIGIRGNVHHWNSGDQWSDYIGVGNTKMWERV